MDTEIKELLLQILEANRKKSPSQTFIEILRPTLIALVVAIPSVLITSTRYITNFENRIAEHDKILKQRAKDTNFNFNQIQQNDKEHAFRFIEIE